MSIPLPFHSFKMLIYVLSFPVVVFSLHCFHNFWPLSTPKLEVLSILNYLQAYVLYTAHHADG